MKKRIDMGRTKPFAVLIGMIVSFQMMTANAGIADWLKRKYHKSERRPAIVSAQDKQAKVVKPYGSDEWQVDMFNAACLGSDTAKDELIKYVAQNCGTEDKQAIEEGIASARRMNANYEVEVAAKRQLPIGVHVEEGNDRYNTIIVRNKDAHKGYDITLMCDNGRESQTLLPGGELRFQEEWHADWFDVCVDGVDYYIRVELAGGGEYSLEYLKR